MDPEGSQGFKNTKLILVVFSLGPLIPKEVRKEGGLETAMKTTVS